MFFFLFLSSCILQGYVLSLLFLLFPLPLLLLLLYAEAAALGAAESATLHKPRAPWGVRCAELNLRARLLSFCIFVLQMEVDGAGQG